jgi:hypothetical protein
MRDALRSAISFFAFVAATVACNGHAPHAPLDDIQILEELVFPIPAEGRQIELFDPTNIVLEADRLVIADAGNQRIVFASRDFELLSSVGRKGYGPGEYQFPTTIVVHENEYYVPDPNTKRISVLSSSGEYLRGIQLPPEAAMPESLALTSTGRIIVPAFARAEYLSIWDPRSGLWNTAVDRYAPLEAHAFGTADYALVTAGDTIHVLDATHGVLTKVSPSLEVLARARFPDHVMEARRARNQRVVESVSGRGRAPRLFVPLFDYFGKTGEGRLIVSFPAGNILGAVIDPHTYAMQLIRAPEDWTSSQTLSVGTRTISGDTLWSISSEGIRLFRISQ